MDVTFLGTASAQPSPTRNHSSLAFRPDGSDVWLFDCGEGTQHQFIHGMARYSDVAVAAPGNVTQVLSAPRLAKISRVFLTHLHGDHCFGLPGLLCTAGAVGDSSEKSNPIHVYGPKGVKAYVRNALLHSMSRVGCGFVLHELLWPGDVPSDNTDKHVDELLESDFEVEWIDGGNGDTSCCFWTIQSMTDNRFEIIAAPIPHTVPTVGYLVREPSSPGRLLVNQVTPILQRNKDALKLKNPMVLLSKLKNGETLYMPDGTVLTPESCLAPRRPGRVVLILGDTNDAFKSAFLPLLNHSDFGVDLVVHEATNACLPQDLANGLTPESVREQTVMHGHSTPEMAGAFAKAVNCKRLVLNHFSSRYKGDNSKESLDIMESLRQLAVNTFESDEIVCARDFMQVAIQQRTS